MIMHLVLVLAVATIAASQHCLYTPPSIPIDLEKFSGPWYAQHRFGSYFVTPNCFRANYTAHKHNEGFSASFEYKNRKNQLASIPLKFEPAESNHYKFSFSGSSYLVAFLAMEYDSYAVFYDCSSTDAFSYVLTRWKERNDALVDQAIKKAKEVSPFLPLPSKKLNCEMIF